VKRLSEQTLYEILEVREDAPVTEIEAACERVRDIYGPGSLATYTLMTPDEASLLARRIDEARATLLDPEARARYDEALRGSGGAVTTRTRPNGRLPTLPPVIPAVQPPPPAAPAAERGSPGESASLPPALPSARVAAGSAAGEAARAPAPVIAPAAKPILLRREVPPSRLPETPPRAAALARELPPPEGPPLPDGSAWTGDALRRAREARGISTQQIAERTKVTRHHIENIEAERFGSLPAPVYLRGILLSIARELRLDGQKVARTYLERAAAAIAEKPK
jgi:curved DNA-binding protein CbpA